MAQGRIKTEAAHPSRKAAHAPCDESVILSSNAPSGYDISHVHVAYKHSTTSGVGRSARGASPPGVTVSIAVPKSAIDAAAAAAAMGKAEQSEDDGDFSFVRTLLEDAIDKVRAADASGSWNGRALAYLPIRHADLSKRYGKALLYPFSPSRSFPRDITRVPNSSFVEKLDSHALAKVWGVFENGGAAVVGTCFAMYFPKARLATRKTRDKEVSVREAEAFRCPRAEGASTADSPAAATGAASSTSVLTSAPVPA